ncbi:MAG: ABC transporter ATP-binding protein [Bacteroidetes bacterium]|nr:MAG: ABC transporter ATP-binding protein [Bacteroidota bacterium]
MLSITNLTYYISGLPLFDNASLHIKPKDKIGLIGLNGKGKSTLLKLINNDLQPDAGSIAAAKNCTIGFLNQDLLSYQTEDAILTVAMEAFKEAVDIQRELEEILHAMEVNYTDELLDKLTHLQEQFERLDGYTMQAKAEEILEGIGFTTEQLHQPLKEFSGGWRMRVMLAKLLLEKPSLLMLDEPTNHLDLPSIRWVENYLRNYDGAVVVVSHDRTFINNVATKTVEVAHKILNLYEGNYDFYVNEKQLRTELQKNAFNNQQQHIKQSERFIERFKAKSTKARQVQSRVKALDKLDLIEDVINDQAAVNFKFKFSQQSGKHITKLKNVSKSYGDLEVISNSTATISRGDKIALIGANGKGKSTLLRIIAGTEPVSGEVEEGFNIITAFFAQHQLESLTMKNEILEELKQAGSKKTEQELRGVLGCFLFSGDDVFKKIKVLSGGEKSRVALAKTLISEANFMMLDEPTNHLDIISENILIQALQQYEGSFVVVSHNRHFISQVANKIWYIEDKQIKEYPGTFQEYEYWQSKRTNNQIQQETKKSKKPASEKTAKPKNKDDQGLKKFRKQLEQVENEIERLEKVKKEVENEMSKPDVYSNPEKLAELNIKLNQYLSDLKIKNKDWEFIAEHIDELD